MDTKAHRRRLARLTHEADQSAVPALAMLVAVVLLVLTLGLAAMQAEPADDRLAEPVEPNAAPAA